MHEDIPKVVKDAIKAEQMTVSDGLHELKRINKLIPHKVQLISTYSSKRHGSKDLIENQKKYVQEQYQSVKDLLTRYTTIKLAINRSNLNTEIVFKTHTLTVAEGILFKQSLYAEQTKLLNAFTLNTGKQQVHEYIAKEHSLNTIGMTEETLQKLEAVPEALYDEKIIQAKKEEYLELFSYIDRLIEKANHETIIQL